MNWPAPYFAATIFLLLGGEGISQGKWDFTGERQPTYRQLWSDELSIIGTGCTKALPELYERYKKRHPEFYPLADDPDMFRQWRKALVISAEEPEYRNFCVYDSIFEKYLQGMKRHPEKNLFCGRLADGIEPEDKTLAEVIEEIAFYAFHGKSLPLKVMLDFHTMPTDRYGIKGSYRLNFDIAYYFQRQIALAPQPTPDSRELVAEYLQPDYGKLLFEKRKRFVDAAFERGDYQAVVETTKPCEQKASRLPYH